MILEEHSFDDVMKRRLFSLAVSSAADLPGRLDLPPGNFVCLLAWNASGTTTAQVSAVVEPLLRAGACYFVCWGPDCGRVHDIIDEIAAKAGSESGIPKDDVIMTTWHDSEPLKEALWFFLASTWPGEHYEGSSHVGLAISIGSQSWAREIATALRDPRGFVERGSEEGAV